MMLHDYPSQDTHFIWYWYLQLMIWGFIPILYLIITRIHIYCWSCLQKSKCSTVISITNENSIKFGLCWSSYSSVVRLFWSEPITMFVTRNPGQKMPPEKFESLWIHLLPYASQANISYPLFDETRMSLEVSHGTKHDRIKATRHRRRQESTLWNNHRRQAALNWVIQYLFLQWYVRERWVFSDVRIWILDSG